VRAAGLVLAVAAAIAIAVVAAFPGDLGYDELAHRGYAELLVHHGHIPGPSESQEYHTPPGFYAVAGAVEAVTNSWDVARGLNVLWFLGAAILSLLIAGELFPRDRLLQLAALAFVCFAPVALKLAAMFHPEELSLFASTLTVYLAVRLVARRQFDARHAAVLGLSLGAAQLVRGFNLWLVPIVLVGLAVARLPARLWLVVPAAAFVVAGPWYIRQAVEYSNPVVFNRPAPHVALWRRRPVAFYTALGLPKSITDPIRPEFTNDFIPTLYSDIWGDYFGYFAWSTAQGGTTPAPLDPLGRRELEAQNVLGFVPTLLAIGGVLALLCGAVRRVDPGVLVVALLPALGLLGFLAFTVAYPSGDGDVIKASYALTTLPGWALGFGYALSRLDRLRPVLLVACGLALASDLTFLLHRGALGPL
jgi:hypothetical protein